jgi:hypothetical protein
MNMILAKTQTTACTPMEHFLLDAENLVLRAKALNISVIVAVDAGNEKPYITANTTTQTSDALFMTIISLAANHPGILSIPDIHTIPQRTEEGAA